MQKNKLPKDLLLEWAREHEVVERRKRVALGVFAAGVAVLGFAELTVFHTLFVLGTICVLAAVLLALAVGIGYSAFVFYLAWSYGAWVRSRGQTRPMLHQLATILCLAVVAAVPFASLTLHDRIDLSFWLCLSFMMWVNASAAVMGYLARFLLDSR